MPLRILARWGAGFTMALAVVAALSTDPAHAQTEGGDVAVETTQGHEATHGHGAAEAVAKGATGAAPDTAVDHPAGDHQADDHGSAGLPQLNPASYASQLFWLAVTFGLLFLLMSRVGLPRVAEVLEARQEKITNDLDKAATLKAEAEGVMQAYEKALQDARTAAQKVIGEAAALAGADAARRQNELAADLAERTREAEGRIQAAKQAALGNVRAVAAEAAQAAAAKLAGLEVQGDQAGAAVEAALKERA